MVTIETIKKYHCDECGIERRSDQSPYPFTYINIGIGSDIERSDSTFCSIKCAFEWLKKEYKSRGN
jgi:wyosine [tRNA(Phe)-imidazoG37] synthetase (radical SAM superfamily)